MNWKRQVAYPVLKAIVFTLASFLMVMVGLVIWSAIQIWGLDRFDPKWGDRWGNFWFNVQIFSMAAGIQTGITFVGSTIYTLIWKTIPVRWAVVSILTLSVIDPFVEVLMDTNEAVAATCFYAFPALALLILLVPVFRKENGNIQPSPGPYPSKAADGLTGNGQE